MVVMAEDMDGLVPRINIVYRVFIDRDMPMKTGQRCVFLVNGLPVTGILSASPTSYILKFLSTDTDWQPVVTTSDQYVGRIMVIHPEWAINSREC